MDGVLFPIGILFYLLRIKVQLTDSDNIEAGFQKLEYTMCTNESVCAGNCNLFGHFYFLLLKLLYFNCDFLMGERILGR